MIMKARRKIFTILNLFTSKDVTNLEMTDHFPMFGIMDLLWDTSYTLKITTEFLTLLGSKIGMILK
jgi:hypothetical protein